MIKKLVDHLVSLDNSYSVLVTVLTNEAFWVS